MKILVFKTILFTVILDIFCLIVDQDITETCREKCKDLSEDLEDSSWTCDSSCRVEQCDNGCSQWHMAVKTTCLDTCSESHNISNKEVQHCIAGCNLAVDIYAQEVKDALAKLSSPELVSKQNESVILKWEGDTQLTFNVSRHLQKVVPGLVSEWQDHDNIEWLSNHQVKVKGLKPYTTYKFRIVIEIVNGRHSEPFPESIDITTLQYGAPIEAPTIVNLATASTSLHIKLKPPFYINAPLVGYEINVNKWEQPGPVPQMITSTRHQFIHDGMTKSVVISNSDLNHETTAVITRLEPSIQYKVEVRLRNENGVGPAVVSYAKTKEANTEWDLALLIYGADNKVLQQKPNDLNPTPETLFESESNDNYVTGVAFHYDQNKVFVSVTSGSIYSVDCGSNNEGSGSTSNGGGIGSSTRCVSGRVTEIYKSSNHPQSLNVDWLNDKLYIAEQDQIIQCSLTGNECITAISDLNPRPEDVKVDPASGYLFWVQDGYGIFRRPLTRLGEDATSPETDKMIISVNVSFAIAIDHTNFRIFYANVSQRSKNGNTLMSANFDGSDIMDIRENIQNPDFILVESITHINRLFIWTNGKKVMLEVKDPHRGNFHHNEMYSLETKFTGLNIWHPSAQPTPVPFMSPRNLQVVFSENSAKLTWDPPGNGQGEGGYNTWQYEIEEINQGSIFNHTFISPHASLYNNVQNLASDTIYSYRVRAFSSAEKGPWCKEFAGSTLKLGSLTSKLYVVDSENALYALQLSGDDLKLLKTYMGYEKFNEFEIHEGERLWSSTEGKIYNGNIPVGDLSHVKTFAYDWIGNTLYWAPTRTTATIRRLSLHNLVDNLSESVVQEAMGNAVENMVVDALQGYLYWTTQLSVEAARMDGRDLSKTIYMVPNAYSGKYVMGMAINYDDNYLYWLLKTGDSTCLFRVELFQQHSESTSGSSIGNTTPKYEYLFEFHTDALPIRMQYYSHKLIWRGSGSRELEILDVETNSLASVALETSGEKIQAFVVDYPDKYRYPDGLNSTTIKVIPASINSHTINLNGKWDSFDITWIPPTVNYGEVYYEVLLSCERRDREIMKDTVEPHLSYLAGFSPYTLLKVTVKACTIWGCSPPVEHHLYTPMAAPSLPNRTRTYVTHHESISSSTKLIKVEFHWDEPNPANGVIDSYTIQVAPDEKGPWTLKSISGQQNYFVATDAKNNTFYYFKVRACTQIACSDYTDVISANTTVQKPVPKLLTTSDNSINMFLPDEKEEAKRSRTLENDQVCAVTYIAREDTYFWLNKQGTIVRKDSKGNTSKVVSTSNTGNSLTVDWVGRDLYWAEQKSENSNTIVKYDLNQHGGKPIIVMSRITVVWKLDISPYRSSLYWTESDSENGRSDLMSSDLEGTSPRPFFSRHTDSTNPLHNHVKRQGCTCTGVPLSKVFVIDQSGGKDAELYFVEHGTKTIWASDLDGCICRVVLNGTHLASQYQSLGLPPDSMTLDQEHLYWSNSQESTLYSVNKWTGEGFQFVWQDNGNLGNLKNIVAYGDHLQPMPDTKCLLIESYTEDPVLIDRTDSSLKLRIIPWTSSTECSGISVPTGKYTVHYKEIYDGDEIYKCNMSGVPCNKKESFDLAVELTDLKPYTHYMVQVSVTNYYMDNRQRKPVFSPDVDFQTKTGVPSQPREVLVIATSPIQAKITWRSPSDLNAPYEDLIYVLNYYTVFGKDRSRSNMEYEINGTAYQGKGEGLFYSYIIEDLKPAIMYNFKIMARTKDINSISNSSEEQWLRTYQQPSRVMHVNHTHSTITVHWKSSTDKSMVKHKIEYIEYAKLDDENSAEWNTPDWDTHKSMNSTEYVYTFTDLKSHTEYAFRVQVVYRSGVEYIWPTEIKKRDVLKTEASLPLAPTAPHLEQRRHGVNVLVWGKPYDGGLNIQKYELFARTIGDLNWTSIYNGINTYWVMDGLHRDQKYIFAVAAKNPLGWSQLSENSSQYPYVPAAVRHAENSNQLTLVLSVTFSMLFLFIIAMILGLLLWKRYRDPQAKKFSLVSGFRHPTDMELATLREMPRVAMQSNALYAINIVLTDAGIAALPHYHREDLTLTKFLGSGAFGEVYEGTATNILSSDSGETKVAVKALKKGATDNEKEEFLKEALLMSNFKHEHILSLLGVCLHNDPQFLILELMAGGDLLTYLRASRSTSSNSIALELVDMVSISVDIAKGCKYLEELHFVHRDLAARNCLVNKTDSGERIVKIGDFGLARDIYKSDYYRKEGEGLMPVRWMSPESLVDGVFTTHSDVWAFGVLMWEVLTLGQQPYPARTNLDVLNYVRLGGRLDRPDNCPDDMYDLMLKCWYYNPDARPSFRSVLCQLETFKRKSQDPASNFRIKRSCPNTSKHAGHDSKTTSPFGMHHGETDSAKSKNLKGNHVKRSFSFDMKGRFGIHQSIPKTLYEGSGYLDPLVPTGEENKYLELLGGNEPVQACYKCGRIGCDERCHRGLLRHSSDCSHSLRSMNKRLQHRSKDDGGKGGGQPHKKGGGKGKSSKAKKCDKVFSDSGSSTSGTGSGMESLPEDSADDTAKVKTVKGTKYRNIANRDNPWLMGNMFNNTGESDTHSSAATTGSNNVPGFLIHPPTLVKRTSFTPSEVDSSLSLSIPPDFDELAPNNRSSVDSNSPLLTWGSTQDSPSKDKTLVYQNGFLVTPSSSGGNKRHHQKDLDYLRHKAKVQSNLETSGESLV